FSVRQNFSFDTSSFYTNNKGYIIPCENSYLLGLLMSKPHWFLITAIAPFVRGGFYEFTTQSVETLPIPQATKLEQQAVSDLASKIQIWAESRFKREAAMCRRIAIDLGGDAGAKLSKKLQKWFELDAVSFRKEVKKCFKQDIPLAERSDWEDYLAAESLKVAEINKAIQSKETELNQLVYALFKLKDKDINLIEQGVHA
ncbi:MAG: TaqI-like C-terminal specificity domain-containing protein, partial [Ghiorsea sp.]|nr:TaqI-like C-terminal specificity domain-containing protein [Ghiorsea sp.]